MALTIGNWIFFACILITGGVLSIICFMDGDAKGWGVSWLILALVVALAFAFGVSWYHNNTAEGARTMKDYRSNLDNGLNRKITITAEDGRLIYQYEGKCDIETSHANSENYILFEGEDGLRRIIYYGVLDTVLIEELAD